MFEVWMPSRVPSFSSGELIIHSFLGWGVGEVCGSQGVEPEWSQEFPHYNPMGAICCHGNQSSDPI